MMLSRFIGKAQRTLPLRCHLSTAVRRGTGMQRHAGCSHASASQSFRGEAFSWLLGAGIAGSIASMGVVLCDDTSIPEAASHAPIRPLPAIVPITAAGSEVGPADRDKHKELEAFRPQPDEGFVRVDTLLESTHYEYHRKNAVHDTLRGESLIEAYEVYHNETTGDIRCIVRFGNALNGHQGIVHGGITALVFDNTFGWLFFMLRDVPAAFTANLSLNYRKKVVEDSTVVIRARLTERKDRKLFMAATMEDRHGVVLADAQSLFIIPRQ